MVGVAIAALAPAVQDANAVKAQIQKEMNGYVAAMKKRDTKQMEKFVLANFDPSFKDTSMDGTTRNRQETIKVMKENIAMLRSVKAMSVKIVSIKVVGNKATTTEEMTLDALIAPMAPNLKASTLKVDSTWMGTYVKKGAKWLCTASKSTKEKVLIDGKPQ